jgi:menaquinol-cytochrome c reductase cytochrome b/c subunit
VKPDHVLQKDSDARDTPVRLLFVQGDERPPVDVSDEPMVMTFPHLVVRELIAFLILSIGLVAVALFFDAPLEEIANPDRTPNPAKAPWYFLGLQELLHYYPPIVSGVLLPGMLVVALAIIPYFTINLERPPMWTGRRHRELVILWVAVAGLSLLFGTTGSHPVWPIIGPLWIVAVLMTWGAFSAGGDTRGLRRWLASRSIPFWVFSWFLLSALALTLIGIFFRGPGWSFTLPWRDGIY